MENHCGAEKFFARKNGKAIEPLSQLSGMLICKLRSAKFAGRFHLRFRIPNRECRCFRYRRLNRRSIPLSSNTV